MFKGLCEAFGVQQRMSSVINQVWVPFFLRISSVSPLFYSPPPIPYQCYYYLLLVRLGEANFAKIILLTSLMLMAILLVAISFEPQGQLDGKEIAFAMERTHYRGNH